MTMRALGSMGSAGSMPDTMDRRDFLIRLAIGAAFALAGVPLLGEWLREWAERRRRLAEWTRQYRALNERIAWKPVHGLASADHFLDQHDRAWTASIEVANEYGASTRPLRRGDPVAVVRHGHYVGMARVG